MLFKSQLVTQVSGSIGGLTGSHNAGGMYFRARAIPTDPNSPQQFAMRQIVSNLANLWRNVLTEGQRALWDFYAANVPLLSPLGDLRTVSGFNMYIRSNSPRDQQGLTRQDDAPLIFNTGEFQAPAYALDEPNDEVDVTFDNTDEWANETGSALLIFASRPTDPTINYWTTPYRLAGAVLGDTTTPPTSPAAIALPFPVGAGQRIFFRCEVTRADGRLSSTFRDRADA